VTTELGNAIGLREAFYIREGTGSSQPFGFVPALTNGPALYRTTQSPTTTTLAGSVARAIGVAAGALLARKLRTTRSPDVSSGKGRGRWAHQVGDY